ncbi:MAG: hypothetical protein A2Y40_04030 [Candidatus Margulisbacteria bacterium GWF2_35_9]|nr:MAG: hypothetical protein A2Y40_04030 [Candidatus Margulisbacteria bacterium GWF2_35_9]
MSIYDQISDEIKTAMKNKDQNTLSVLRMIKSKIMTINARGELSDEEIIKIIRTYENNLVDAMEQASQLNRESEALQLKKEIDIVSRYLPKNLSEKDTYLLVEKIIKETNASSKKDMGIVMKSIMSSGEVLDGKLVKKIVDEKLG